MRHVRRVRAATGLGYPRRHQALEGVFRFRNTIDPDQRTRSAEEKAVGGVLALNCVFVAETFEKRCEGRQVVVFDFETGEHAAEVRPVIAVVEQADVPAAGERVEEVGERARTLRELEAAEPFVLHLWRMSTDHVK